MKYFNEEYFRSFGSALLRTKNGRKRAEERFQSACDAYYRELEALRRRVSGAAWNFFRHGFAEKGLHDARLLSLTFGDRLSYVAGGKFPFRLNCQRTSVRVEFLGQDQSYRHTFDLRGVSRIDVRVGTEKLVRGRCLGDLNAYELTSESDQLLRLSFLFASGGEIEIVFVKLLYKRRRILREYELDAIYY